MGHRLPQFQTADDRHLLCRFPVRLRLNAKFLGHPIDVLLRRQTCHYLASNNDTIQLPIHYNGCRKFKKACMALIHRGFSKFHRHMCSPKSAILTGLHPLGRPLCPYLTAVRSQRKFCHCHSMFIYNSGCNLTL